MKVKEYLQNRLENSSKYSLSTEDQELLDTKGMEEYIFKKLMSKKFRKWSLPESVQEQIRDQIKYCVENNRPIALSLSYGGFKLWRLPTTPEVDWSEFFYIAYHLEYMAPIAKAYKPGVVLDFSSADIAVTAVNNVPRNDVDQYDQSLKALIEVFKLHLPKNVHITTSRLRDLFKDEQEFINEGEKQRPQARERFAANNQLADEFRRGTIQNLQLVGGNKNLAALSEAELNKERERAAEIIESMYFIPQIADQDERGIIALMATNIELDIPMITTGTTKRSAAKFWAGLGVLTRDGESFAEYVITPKQWEGIKDKPHESVTLDIVPLKNFKEILVYPNAFNFSQKS